MAKRMLDSGLINQRWYMELAPKYKSLYIHLLCSCDCVGVFEINPVVMGLYIGDSITDDDIFTKFGNRVQRMPNNDSKGILVDFLYFQCGGELKEGCKPHESYIKHLKEVGLTVEQLQSMCTKTLYWTRIERPPQEPPKYVRPLISTVQAPPPNELQTRPEDRGKEFDTYVASKFAEFWLAYPRHDSRAQAMAKFTRTIKNEKPDKRDDLVKKMIAAVNKAKKSDQWSKDDGQFIPMATTWINQRRWEDEGIVMEAGATQTASEEQKQRISNLFEPL